MAPKSKDPAWIHADVIEGKLYCKYCRKWIKGGGIHRLKQHLAVRGNVAPCEADLEVIGEIRLELQQQFEQYEVEKANKKERGAKIGKKRQLAEMMRYAPHVEFEGSSSIPSTTLRDPFQYVCPFQTNKPKKKNNIQSYFTPLTTSDSATASQPIATQIQPPLDADWKKQYKEVANEYIARWWYDADIPFNAACSPYFQPMWDSVIAAGKGFKGPSMHELRGSLLHKEMMSIDEYFKEFKESWVRTGCTIMSNGWTNGRNRTIINFFVSCPQGTMFLKSCDASDKVKDANLLFQLLDEIVMLVGVDNVVQVITDNASNYVLAGKMLEEKYKTIFWTPCAARCIDLMLEDICKQDWIKNTVEHAKSITKYIYNNSWVLSLLRKHTQGGELVRPTITRFATHFFMLQSLIAQRQNLEHMFLSDEWNSTKWARRTDGKDTKKKILESSFWKKASKVLKIIEPLVKVLRLVDGEKLAMGYIYEAMYQAKEQIRAAYKDRVAKYGPIWDFIDRRWNNQFHRPIHAAGYSLNPRHHYRYQFEEDQFEEDQPGDVKDGLYECLERMVPNEMAQLEIYRQMCSFTRDRGTFGQDVAYIARDVDQPAQWWESFGSQCPQLQKFAIRVLSQPCSSSRCERNWSAFERIHMKKRNHLEQKRLNDLVFVQYNLRLRRNQLLNKSPDTDPIVLDDIDPTSEWVEETQQPEFGPDFDIDTVTDDLALDVDPLGVGDAGAEQDPGMADNDGGIGTGSSRPSHTARASTSATARVVDVREESDSEESEPYVDVEHSISSSGAEFDD